MDEILKQALRMGIIDSFDLIGWWSKGLTNEVILTNVEARLRNQRSRFI